MWVIQIVASESKQVKLGPHFNIECSDLKCFELGISQIGLSQLRQMDEQDERWKISFLKKVADGY